MTTNVFTARAVQRAFSAASHTYDAAAHLQTTIRQQLLERLTFLRFNPTVILDLGAGTGQASKQLKKRFPRAHIIALDLSEAMLLRARKQQTFWRRFARVCADAQLLPFQSASIDLVFSNLMLQWCLPPDSVFQEIRRVLKPQGVFSFTTFGPDTLYELRNAWATVDPHSHVNPFTDMHDVGDALVRAQLADPVLDVEHHTVQYDQVHALMRDLKAIGAHNITPNKNKGLTGRNKMRTMIQAYEQFRRNNTLPATYEIIYGQAWAPIAPQHHAPQDEIAIPVTQIGLRKR